MLRDVLFTTKETSLAPLHLAMKIISLLTVVLLVTAIHVPAVESGFGCPGDEYECNGHCKNSVGCRGGYCDALKFDLVCTCYGCESESKKGTTASA